MCYEPPCDNIVRYYLYSLIKIDLNIVRDKATTFVVLKSSLGNQMHLIHLHMNYDVILQCAPTR